MSIAQEVVSMMGWANKRYDEGALNGANAGRSLESGVWLTSTAACRGLGKDCPGTKPDRANALLIADISIVNRFGCRDVIFGVNVHQKFLSCI